LQSKALAPHSRPADNSRTMPSLIGSLSAASTPVMVIAAGEADAVAFGKAFIANPDLVRRPRDEAPLNRWDSATFYEGKDKGYTDYPPLAV
jgi:2,4-dienoyl-CoA reductase-like NADH-dependent reductase (Old Yellow Enzyme family)